jgi:hypothetical protein
MERGQELLFIHWLGFEELEQRLAQAHGVGHALHVFTAAQRGRQPQEVMIEESLLSSLRGDET